MTSETPIIRCKRCIMDNSSDNTITFDENGYCNYCTNALARKGSVYFPNEEGQTRLEKLLKIIKASGYKKKYDCIMGISGGLDSSYLAYLGYKWGLRILAVHIDDGFDTDISKTNIKKLISASGFDYITLTPDPEQFNGLIKAYMKAGVANLAAPQDNVMNASINAYIKKHGIKYCLSGGNFSLECILQTGNTFDLFDTININAIHSKYGEKPIDKLIFISKLQKEINKRVLRIHSPRPLDYIDYNRDKAFRELKEFCGFEYYGSKHLENILTAFVQLYWFPKKFNVDKRTSHLSSMIVSGQMTREEALAEYAKPLYDESLMNHYISIIKEKLQLTDEEFDEIMRAPTHEHTEFKYWDNTLLGRVLNSIKKHVS